MDKHAHTNGEQKMFTVITKRNEEKQMGKIHSILKKGTTGKLTADEKDFQQSGEFVEQMAILNVTMSGDDVKSTRALLEKGGVDAAKEAGIDPKHARTIIDGVLAKFDADVTEALSAGPDADADDAEEESALRTG